jgi:hypothetical protein
MDDHKQQEDRWRELAELLGLPGDTPAPAKSEKPAPPAPKPETPAIKAYEEPPALVAHQPAPELHHVEDEAPSIPMTRQEPMSEWEAEFEEDEDTSLEEKTDVPFIADEDPMGEDPTLELKGLGEPKEPSESNEPSEPNEQGEPGAVGEDGKPRRGRRRRRRGRRRGGDKPEGEVQPTGANPAETREEKPMAPRPPREERPASPRPPRDADADPRGQRGRGRGGKRREEEPPRRPAPPPRQERRPEPEPQEAAAFEHEPALGHAPISHDDTDFSDWKVPSWQELISSLYRPDR